MAKCPSFVLAATCLLFGGAAAAAIPLAFVPGDQPATELFVIDATTDTVLTQISIPSTGLNGVQVNPPVDRVYAWGITGLAAPDMLHVIDASTLAVVDSMSFPNTSTGTLTGVTTSPDGQRFYVSLAETLEVQVFDSSDNSFVTSIPMPAGVLPGPMALTPDGSRLYVTNLDFDDNTLAVAIDTASATVDAQIPALGRIARDIVILPTADFAYVGNERGDELFVIDLSTDTVSSTIPLAGQPLNLALSPSGDLLAAVHDNTVEFIDTATNSILAGALSGAAPREVSFHPDGSRLYAINFGSDYVSVFDTTTFARIDRIRFENPQAFCCDFVGEFVAGGGDVLEIPAASHVGLTVLGFLLAVLALTRLRRRQAVSLQRGGPGSR